MRKIDARFGHGLVQIAGVRDAAEAALLVRAEVDWIGFPLHLAYHQPDVTEREAVAIMAALPPGVQPVVITYQDRAAAIAALCQRLGRVAGVQLHGDIDIPELRQLRERLPSLFIVKSLIVRAGAGAGPLLDLAGGLTPYVDAFITDTYDPATGACGATGKTHDWAVSRQLVANVSRPVILAGGLTAENVGAAIAGVRPAGVDAHTGVEGATGRKEPRLVAAFVREARAAFSRLEARR